MDSLPMVRSSAYNMILTLVYLAILDKSAMNVENKREDERTRNSDKLNVLRPTLQFALLPISIARVIFGKLGFREYLSVDIKKFISSEISKFVRNCCGIWNFSFRKLCASSGYWDFSFIAGDRFFGLYRVLNGLWKKFSLHDWDKLGPNRFLSKSKDSMKRSVADALIFFILVYQYCSIIFDDLKKPVLYTFLKVIY